MSSLGFPRAALSTIKSSHSVPNRPLPTTTQTAPATKSHGPHPVLPMPAWAANRLSGNGAVVWDDQNLPYKPLTNVIFVYITWWWPWVRRGEVSCILAYMQTLALTSWKHRLFMISPTLNVPRVVINHFSPKSGLPKITSPRRFLAWF